MLRLLVRVWFLGLLMIFSFGLLANSYTHPGHHSYIHTGHQLIELKDQHRLDWTGTQSRPLHLHLYYPTFQQRDEVLRHRSFVHGTVAENAPFIDRKMPLILLSHGSQGSAHDLLWLTEALVQAGFMVAAVDHHGNTSAESRHYHGGEFLWWERAGDLQYVVRFLRKDRILKNLVDTQNIGIVGYSIGGYTAMSNLGAITDRVLFEEFCRAHPYMKVCFFFTTEIHAEDKDKGNHVLSSMEHAYKDADQRMNWSYLIPEIKAAVLLAPAALMSLTSASLKTIKAPVLTYIAAEDRVTYTKNQPQILNQLATKPLIKVLPGFHHYTFTSSCEPWLAFFLDHHDYCKDHKELNRDEEHHKLRHDIKHFLSERLHIRKMQIASEI